MQLYIMPSPRICEQLAALLEEGRTISVLPELERAQKVEALGQPDRFELQVFSQPVVPFNTAADLAAAIFQVAVLGIAEVSE